MGVTTAWQRVDPLAWARAVSGLEDRGLELLDHDRAAAWVQDLGGTVTQQVEDALDGVDQDDPRTVRDALHALLTAAVCRREWDMDRSILDLQHLTERLPGARAVTSILEWTFDTEVPEPWNGLESGLIGWVSAERVGSDLMAVVGRYPDVTAVTQGLPQAPRLLQRFGLGRGSRGPGPTPTLTDAEAWAWSTFVTAVRSAAGHSHGLGLSWSG